MEFSEVKAEIQSWLLDLPAGATSRIPGWANEAVRMACERHNFREMESELTPTTVDQQRLLVAKPADWKEGRGDPYLINQGGTVTMIDWAASADDMARTYAAQLPDEGNAEAPDEGPPRYVLETATELEVFPLPDNESDWDNGLYRTVVPYWAFPATLSGDADTNFLTTGAPYYLIFKGASLGFAWNRDEERAEYYEKKAEAVFRSFRRRDKMSQVPDRMTLAPNADVYAMRSRSGNRG